MRASGISSKLCKNISGSHTIILHVLKKKTLMTITTISKCYQKHEGTTSLHLNKTTEWRVGVEESTGHIPHENHTKIQS